MPRHLRFVLILLAVSLVGTTWAFWAYEHGVNAHIKSYQDVLWWWFVSSTTVGYGDIAPITPQGRLAAVVTIIVGIYCYTNFITITADSLHGLSNRKHLGTAPVRATGHIVIGEYTAFADELLQALPQYPGLARREVVIVTDLVQVRPYAQHHFVRGVPISPVALKQASIGTAAVVFLYANVRYLDPDLKTLHTCARILKLAPNAKIFIELNNPQHELAAHLGERVSILASRALLEAVMHDRAPDLGPEFPRG